MESHPLNLAHQQYRRAEAHLKNNRFDEAIQSHHNAAELLLDAMKYSTSSVALESLSIQHSYHLKQKDLVKLKKERYARVKKSMENMKLLSKDPYLNIHGNDNTKLQVAIFKALNESDALLNTLSSSSEDSLKKNVVKEHDTIDGRKKEKPQQMVVEELQILSQNLHSLIEQLVLKVEVLKDENMSLNERVSYLEKERTKYLNISTQDVFVPGNNFSNVGETYSHGLFQSFAKTETNNSAGLNQSSSESVEQSSKQVHFDLSTLKKNII